MDKAFLKFVEDFTRDGWSFLSVPKELEIQRDDDFLRNQPFMKVETKVARPHIPFTLKIRLLLQFSIASQSYCDAHKNMIQTFVQSCLKDESTVVFLHPVDS